MSLKRGIESFFPSVNPPESDVGGKKQKSSEESDANNECTAKAAGDSDKSATESATHNNKTRLKIPALLDGELFAIESVNESTKDCQALCKLCVKKKIISGNLDFTGNFFTHIQRCHSSSLDRAKKKREEGAAARKSKPSAQEQKASSKTSVHPFLGSNSAVCITQAQATDAIADFVVQKMQPLSVVQAPSFRNLVETLAKANPVKIACPGRKALGTVLNQKLDKMVDNITAKFDSVKYVCTTADLWTKNKKGFLGVTGHYIDPKTFQRVGYALACMRFKMRHTYDRIAKALHGVHKKYRLIRKVTFTVTDNASNFGKAFREYSNPESENAKDESETDGSEDNVSTSESENDGDDSGDEDGVGNPLEFPVIQLARFVDDDDGEVVSLPEQIRCHSHSLNLVATTDIEIPKNEKKDKEKKLEIPGIMEFEETDRAVFGKLGKLLMRLSKSTVASDICQEVCGTSFGTPTYTRWNSRFDWVGKIISSKKTVPGLCKKLGIPRLEAADFEYLTEWHATMEPLAKAIDMLQGEKTCYLGQVIPTIRSTWLWIKGKKPKLCKPLQTLLLRGLEKRFPSFTTGDIFAEREDRKYLLASISTPSLKLQWLPETDRPKAEAIFIEECCRMSEAESEPSARNPTQPASSNTEEEDSSSKNFFSVLGLKPKQPPCNTIVAARVDALKYLQEEDDEVEMLHRHPIVKEVFLKYNTALPSSAPVERLFSDGGRTVRPDRNRLSDKNIETCILLKANATKKF